MSIFGDHNLFPVSVRCVCVKITYSNKGKISLLISMITIPTVATLLTVRNDSGMCIVSSFYASNHTGATAFAL